MANGNGNRASFVERLHLEKMRYLIEGIGFDEEVGMPM